jgi:hypothetical protein
MSWRRSEPALTPAWPCAGCGLLCSDAGSGGDACGLRRSWLTQGGDRSLGLPQTAAGTLAATGTLATARGWLTEARRILVTGYLSDVGTSRAAIQLAAACSGAVDHAESQAAFEQLLSWQRRGAICCTLGEAAWRADAVLLLDATRLMQAYPQLARRLSSNLERDDGVSGLAETDCGAAAGALAGELVDSQWAAIRSSPPPSWKTGVRRLLWIDPDPGDTAQWGAVELPTTDAAPQPADWQRLGWQVESLTVPIGDWHHLWVSPSSDLDESRRSAAAPDGGPWAPPPAGQAVATAAAAIAQLQRSSRYLAVLWPPTITRHPHPGLLLDRLTDWLVAVNQHSRAAALPLAGPSVTFHQVCGWLTGYPGRVQFSEGAAVYQPGQLWGRAGWTPEAADLLIWIDTGGGWQAPPPKLPDRWPGRCVALSPTLPGWLPPHVPAVHLPVGQSGWELAGYRFRADAGELVRLQGELPGDAPSGDAGAAVVPAAEHARESRRSAADWLGRLLPMVAAAGSGDAAELSPSSAEPGRERWD